VLFREIPFLRLLLPLCLGVIIAEVAPGYDLIARIVSLVVFTALTIMLLRTIRITDTVFGAVIMIFIFACGYLLYENQKEKLSHLGENEQVFVLRLLDYPDKKASGYSFRARMESVDYGKNITRPKGSLLLYFMTDSLKQVWHPGDRLTLRTIPRTVKNNGNPCEFNYKRYMEGQGIRYFGFFREEDLISCKSPPGRSLREISLIGARKMTDAFAAAGLSGDDLGLVTALTIGEKDLLDRELLTSFSRAGAMHIMAVSGLHVGMISLCLSSLLFFLRRRLIIVKVIIVLTGLWAFAFLTGLSPSVLRATIMFSFLQAGKLLNRPGNNMNILLASAFLLVIARPAVLFEAGFQLSYLAVAFIIAFYEPLYKILRTKNKILDWLWQMVAVSLVAQAGTFPLTVRLFNIFPLLFLVTNIVIIPVSFAVIVLAFMLVIFSFVSPVAALFAVILRFLSQATLHFTTYVASLQNTVVDNIGFTGTETILLTLATWLLLTAILRVKRINLIPFLITISIFLVFSISKNINESLKEGPVIYNIRGKKFEGYQKGRVLILNSGKENIPAEVKKHASTRGLKIELKPDK